MSTGAAVAATAAQTYLGLYGQGINAAAQVGTAAMQAAMGGDADSGRGRFDLSKFMDGGGFHITTGSARASATTTGGGRTTNEPAAGPAYGAGFGGLSDQAAMALAAALIIGAALLGRRKA